MTSSSPSRPALQVRRLFACGARAILIQRRPSSSCRKRSGSSTIRDIRAKIGKWVVYLSLFQHGQALSGLCHGKPPFLSNYDIKRLRLDLQYSGRGHADLESRARLKTRCGTNRLRDYNPSRCIDGRCHGRNLTAINAISQPISQFQVRGERLARALGEGVQKDRPAAPSPPVQSAGTEFEAATERRVLLACSS